MVKYYTIKIGIYDSTMTQTCPRTDISSTSLKETRLGGESVKQRRSTDRRFLFLPVLIRSDSRFHNFSRTRSHQVQDPSGVQKQPVLVHWSLSKTIIRDTEFKGFYIQGAKSQGSPHERFQHLIFHKFEVLHSYVFQLWANWNPACGPLQWKIVNPFKR